jgi:FXSXX-COOH protein
MSDTTEFTGELIDVTGLTLRDLDQVEPSRLAQALRQVLEEEEIGPVARFGSRI